MELRERLSQELTQAKEYVALAKIKAAAYQKTNVEIIKYLTADQNTPGVYVTLNKPFETMKKLFTQQGVANDLIIFIDAVTKTSGGQIERVDNCLFIGSPENLSDISLAMDQAVRAVPGKEKFLFFDSLNTLLIYNKPATVAKFVHFLSGKMRVWGVKGIIVSLEKESDKELLEELGQFCDITLDL